MAHSNRQELHTKLPQDSSIMNGMSRLAETRGGGGVSLEDVPVGAAVVVATGHHSYRLENLGDGNVLISGHPKYCPRPVAAKLLGSIGTDGWLKSRYLGKGFQMVFQPSEHEPVRTSPITAISQSDSAPPASN